MTYAKLERKQDLYLLKESDTAGLEILGSFLKSDVGYSRDSIESWIKYITDPNYDSTTSNYSFLDKEDGKLILGREADLLDDEWEKAYEDALELSPQQLIDVLNSWYELCSRKPQEIIIAQDSNNKITLEGRNFPVIGASGPNKS